MGVRTDCLGDVPFKSVKQTLHALAHGSARNRSVEGGPRRKASSRRRTGRHIRDNQVEKRSQRYCSVAAGQGVVGGLQELLGVLVEGAQENRFFVTVRVVEAATLDTCRRGKVLHCRVVETFPPEHIKRDRDYLTFVKLARARHRIRPVGPFLTFSSTLTFLSRMASGDMSAMSHHLAWLQTLIERDAASRRLRSSRRYRDLVIPLHRGRN